ncbi:MAG: oxidoreductase [Pseudomonadota bacterium]
MTDLPEQPQPTVDAIYAAREREAAERPRYESWGVSASALGHECDRKLWLDLRWVSASEVFEGRKLRIFERGDIEEQRVIEDLRRAGLEVQETDPATGRQFRFSFARGFIRGKTDGRCWGVLEAPKAEHVLEIKSMKAADWRAVKKHGLAKKKPEHWHQLHAGMVGLGVERGFYIAVNKDTEEILTERLHLDIEQGARQATRVESLLEMHSPPLRIREDVGFPCSFCQHKAFCHEGGWARRTCRSCLHFSFSSDGAGHCSRFDEPRGPKVQPDGCPAHLFLPALVPGEQVDADPGAETVTYRMSDGSEWVDGGGVDG